MNIYSKIDYDDPLAAETEGKVRFAACVFLFGFILLLALCVICAMSLA